VGWEVAVSELRRRLRSITVRGELCPETKRAPASIRLLRTKTGSNLLYMKREILTIYSTREEAPRKKAHGDDALIRHGGRENYGLNLRKIQQRKSVLASDLVRRN